MDENARDNVNKYIAAEDTPLKFYGYTSAKSDVVLSEISVKNMVLRVLKLSTEYPSVLADDASSYQCKKDKMRSSLDIWRHIKYFYPEISIFDVMKALYELSVKKKIYGHFCTGVGRRVFQNEYAYIGDFHQINMMSYAGRDVDEYGLKWSQWENI